MSRPEKENKFNRQLSSLMDSMLKNGVRVKSAAEVGKRAVQFTRGDEILKWVINNKELAYSKCSIYFETAKLEDEADVANFVDTLIENGFMYRAQYQPLEGALEKSESGSIKRPVWPKRLIKTQKQRFDTLGFYIISYEGSQKWNYLKLSGILFGVLALCMFKAWPLYLKLSMWYISVVLLTFLIVAIVLRLLLFLIMWFGGYDFWLFPNLFDEDLGVVDSFKPLYSLTYRKDNLMMIACRILCAVLIAVSTYQLGKTHDINDIYMFTKQSFLDVLDWGHQKLIAVPEDTSFYKSIGADLSAEFTEKVSETAEEVDDDDYNCLFKCGFKSLEDLITNCMKNCDCMSNLLENDCLKDCPQETINSLTEAKLDVCKRVRR
ncbi:translocation protein [Theileria orientalis]|uniref:Translocation protein SEC62 n=1 Tax=Theileria orientalis TaxID=68886 RepID=A0A976MCI5_THEOR|nr:translocation protein [Theileria orientalis]